MESVEWPAQIDALRMLIDNGRQQISHSDRFELGIALAEELDRIEFGVEPLDPAPNVNTELLRSVVARALAECTDLQKFELGTVLAEGFEAVRLDFIPPENDHQIEVEDDGPSLTYEAFVRLHKETGIGTMHAWTHGWNRARSLGYLNAQGELPISKIGSEFKKWSKFQPYGVGKATLRVYQTLVDRFSNN